MFSQISLSLQYYMKIDKLLMDAAGINGLRNDHLGMK